uniref:UDP-glucose 4-epimerase n=1 Tax=Kuenenia stuttgartiensis TaxID=174633 RepID=Q1PVW9_KUEST|nr:similar to UDPglucose 4-epimerase [Candidatus Kuenenia stuttgartiensis]
MEFNLRALVLGGNGFIGSHLVDRLLVEGHYVRVFDRYEERYRRPLDLVDYRNGDFGNRGLLVDALQEMDTVFHLISTTLPKTSNDDPAFDVSSNVVESIFLLEQCVAAGIKKIVFISSGGAIYGNPKTLPIAEDSPTEPLCSYGITKLANEKYLGLFSYLYGLDYVVLRPSNPYGERQYPFGIQGAISVFLGKVAKGEAIGIWGDGRVIRDYIYINDLIDGIYRASAFKTESRVFNLGSGKGCSLNEIIKIIRQVTGRDVKVIYKEKRSFDVPAIYLDITRATSELSWEPRTSLEAGFEKTWQFISKIL